MTHLKRTIKLVTLKVLVVHEPGIDPTAICNRAEFAYDDTDGAIAGVEIVSMTDVKVDQAEIVPESTKRRINPYLLEAMKAYH